MAQAPGATLGPGNVTRLEYEAKRLVIVGTAHVSKRSVEEVERVIAEERPDTVCVELDETRYRMLVGSEGWKDLNVAAIIRDGRALFQLSTLLLSGFQRRLGKRLGVRPGAEMLAAIQAARELGAEIVLADRDVHATLKRSARNLSATDKAKLFAVLLAASFSSSRDITEEQIEKLKDRDTMGEMMKLFAEEMPALQIPLIDERDRYLMSSVQEAKGRKIVAVVGAGHVAGMTRYLGATVDRAALSLIPEPSPFSKLKSWVVPALLLALFAVGFGRSGASGLLDMLSAFAMWASGVTAVACLSAGGKWLTLLTTIVIAPLSVLLPPVSAGKIAGLLEARLRKPGAADGERLPEDLLTARGIYANPFTRVLLVSSAVSAGTKVGGLVSAVRMATLL